MKTTWFFYRTNATCGIIATCGDYASDIFCENGFYESFQHGNVDLCDSNVVSVLRSVFASESSLMYDFEDLKRDFPDSIFKFDKDDFECLEVIFENEE